MRDEYKNALSKIQVSDHFKEETLQRLKASKKDWRERLMVKKLWIGLAACAVIMVSILGFKEPETLEVDQVAIDLSQRIVVDTSGPNVKAVVNIEGIITDVGEDGLSFELDNKQWVKVNDATIIGITGPTAAPKEDQFFEPTFRLGNSIAGFALEADLDEVEAYAIYTNWNWDDPIK